MQKTLVVSKRENYPLTKSASYKFFLLYSQLATLDMEIHFLFSLSVFGQLPAVEGVPVKNKLSTSPGSRVNQWGSRALPPWDPNMLCGQLSQMCEEVWGCLMVTSGVVTVTAITRFRCPRAGHTVLITV